MGYDVGQRIISLHSTRFFVHFNKTTAAGIESGPNYRTPPAGLPANSPNATSITAPTVMPQSAILKTG